MHDVHEPMHDSRPRLVSVLLVLTLVVVAASWFLAQRGPSATRVMTGPAATDPAGITPPSGERLVLPAPPGEGRVESLEGPSGWGSVEVLVVAPGLAAPPSTSVELVSTDTGESSVPLAGETDPAPEPAAEQGSFLFPEVAAGRHRVRVNAGYPFATQEQDIEVRGAQRTHVEIVLEPRFLLRVRVVAGTPGEPADPIPAAFVQLIAHDRWLDRLGAGGGVGALETEAPRSATTAADGTTSFDGVPEGRFVLSVSAAERVAQDRLLEFTATALEDERFLMGQELLVRLPKAAHSLEGRVSDARGLPLAGCLVCMGPDPREPQTPRYPRKGGAAFFSRAAPAFAVTDAEGYFRMQVPAEQEGSVLFACPGDPALPPVYPFLAWVKSDRTRPLHLRIPDCPRVQLSFEDVGGAPGLGEVRVEDERLTVTHLGEDPYLSRVPAFAERFEPPREPGRVDLHLRPGVYRVHHVDGELKHSYHLTVEAGIDIDETFSLAGDRDP